MASERFSGEVEVGTLKSQKEKQNSHVFKEKGNNVKDSSSVENVREVNKKCDNVTLFKLSLLLQCNQAMKDGSLASKPSMTKPKPKLKPKPKPKLKPKAQPQLAQESGSPVDADAGEGTPGGATVSVSGMKIILHHVMDSFQQKWTAEWKY